MLSAWFVFLCILGGCCGLNPNAQKSYSYWTQRVREDRLSHYDKVAAPTAERSCHASAAGTDVEIQIRLFKLMKVAASDGAMQLKVWWRMQWTDERLSWDPEAFGGVTEVYYNAASFALPEDSEIWLPDVQAYNARVSMTNEFEPAMAKVSSDGKVFWTRPGILDVMCRFSGLIMFPNDILSCPVDIGGWIYSGRIQGVRSLSGANGGCANHDVLEEVGLPSYQEEKLVRVECSETGYSYSSDADVYPILKYRIFVRRAKAYYELGVLVPCILFTCLSFTVFFMSFEVGERLGVGVTLVLTIEVARSQLQSVLPVCGELLWLQMLFLVNLTFTIVSLVESCIVLGLAYTDAEYVDPSSIVEEAARVLGSLLRPWQWHKRSEMVSPDVQQPSQSVAGEFLRQRTMQAGLSVPPKRGSPHMPAGAGLREAPEAAAQPAQQPSRHS